MNITTKYNIGDEVFIVRRKDNCFIVAKTIIDSIKVEAFNNDGTIRIITYGIKGGNINVRQENIFTNNEEAVKVANEKNIKYKNTIISDLKEALSECKAQYEFYEQQIKELEK